MVSGIHYTRTHVRVFTIHTQRHILLRYSGYLYYYLPVFMFPSFFCIYYTRAHTVVTSALLYSLPMLLILGFFCFLPRLLPMCLSKLPRDAVPLSAEDEAACVDSLQMYGGERRMGAVTPGKPLERNTTFTRLSRPSDSES